jgi:hypothetical protein
VGKQRFRRASRSGGEPVGILGAAERGRKAITEAMPKERVQSWYEYSGNSARFLLDSQLAKREDASVGLP